MVPGLSHFSVLNINALPRTTRMPPLKPSAMILSKTPFVKIPRIGASVAVRGRDHVYCKWLGEFLTIPHNQSVFSRSEKQVVDECFRMQAIQEFPCGSGNVQSILEEGNGDIFTAR
jgi:hypothetical protein